MLATSAPPGTDRPCPRARAWSASLALALLVGGAEAHDLVVERLTEALGGGAGNGNAVAVDVSPDGMFVAFETTATDLVANADGNGTYDVFLYDRNTGVIELVSRTPANVAGDARSGGPAVSQGGEYVVFHSLATDLTSPPTPGGQSNVLIWTRATGAIAVVNLDWTGQVPAGFSGVPAITPDGRYVAFESNAELLPGYTAGTTRLYLVDRNQPGPCILLSTNANGVDPNGPAGNPALSADGRYASFWCAATNLGTPSNGARQTMLRDLATGSLSLLSADPALNPGNGASYGSSISADGRYVAYVSDSTNVLPRGTLTNGLRHAFLYDRLFGTNQLVSARPDWSPANPSAQANGPTNEVELSADGRFVALGSHATNLLTPVADPGGHGDVFVRDRDPDGDGFFDEPGVTLSLVSRRQEGGFPNGSSLSPSMDASGSVIAFLSQATDVVPGPDANGGAQDVFLHHSSTRLVPFCFGDLSGSACPCQNTGGAGQGCEHSAITGGGRLDGAGLPCLASDDLRLDATTLAPNKPALFFQGEAVVPQQFVAFGDGLRCVAGPIRRLLIRSADGNGNVSIGAGIAGDPPLSMLGQIPAAGGTRYYQVWFRDPVNYCTPDGFNFSSGLIVNWTP